MVKLSIAEVQNTVAVLGACCRESCCFTSCRVTQLADDILVSVVVHIASTKTSFSFMRLV
uniref:Uncharacterized protein n=1 Tax=Anguilla anguilla TaxID=7936 RepID=A0A0E9VHN6_ANGAN